MREVYGVWLCGRTYLDLAVGLLHSQVCRRGRVARRADVLGSWRVSWLLGNGIAARIDNCLQRGEVLLECCTAGLRDSYPGPGAPTHRFLPHSYKVGIAQHGEGLRERGVAHLQQVGEKPKIDVLQVPQGCKQREARTGEWMSMSISLRGWIIGANSQTSTPGSV